MFNATAPLNSMHGCRGTVRGAACSGTSVRRGPLAALALGPPRPAGNGITRRTS